MKLTLPIGALSDVEALADALEAASRAHRTAAIGAAEALEADRADGEPPAAGAAELVLATLARAGVLERLGTAARTAIANAAPADGAWLQQAVAAAAAAQAAPVFLPPGPPVPTPAATAPLDPELDQVDIFAPGMIT